MRRVVFDTLLVCAVVLAGCGTDDNPATGGAAGAGGSAAGGTGGIGGGSAGAGGANPACTTVGFSPVEQVGLYDVPGSVSGYSARDSATEPTNLLLIELGAATGPFSQQFDDAVGCVDDPDEPSAVRCVTVHTECVDVGDLWDHTVSGLYDCSVHQAIVEGTLDVSTLEQTAGGTVAGTLRDAVLVEIDQGAPVPDADRWCIDELAFSASVQLAH